MPTRRKFRRNNRNKNKSRRKRQRGGNWTTIKNKPCIITSRLGGLSGTSSPNCPCPSKKGELLDKCKAARGEKKNPNTVSVWYKWANVQKDRSFDTKKIFDSYAAAAVLEAEQQQKKIAELSKEIMDESKQFFQIIYKKKGETITDPKLLLLINKNQPGKDSDIGSDKILTFLEKLNEKKNDIKMEFWNKYIPNENDRLQMIRYYEATAGEGFIIDINENEKKFLYKSGGEMEADGTIPPGALSDNNNFGNKDFIKNIKKQVDAMKVKKYEIKDLQNILTDEGLGFKIYESDNWENYWKGLFEPKIEEEKKKKEEGKTQEVYFIGKLMEKCYNKVKADFELFKSKVATKGDAKSFKLWKDFIAIFEYLFLPKEVFQELSKNGTLGDFKLTKNAIKTILIEIDRDSSNILKHEVQNQGIQKSYIDDLIDIIEDHFKNPATAGTPPQPQANNSELYKSTLEKLKDVQFAHFNKKSENIGLGTNKNDAKNVSKIRSMEAPGPNSPEDEKLKYLEDIDAELEYSFLKYLRRIIQAPQEGWKWCSISNKITAGKTVSKIDIIKRSFVKTGENCSGKKKGGRKTRRRRRKRKRKKTRRRRRRRR